MEIKSSSRNYFVIKEVDASARAETMICRAVTGRSERFVTASGAQYFTVNRIKDRAAIRVYLRLFEERPEVFTDCFTEDADLCVVFPYGHGVSLEEYLLRLQLSQLSLRSEAGIEKMLELALSLVSKFIIRDLPFQICYQMLSLEALYVDSQGALRANYFLETPVEIDRIGEKEVLQRLGSVLETLFIPFLNQGGKPKWWQFRKRKYQRLNEFMVFVEVETREGRLSLLNLYNGLKTLQNHYKRNGFRDFSWRAFWQQNRVKVLRVLKPVFIGLVCVALTFYLYNTYFFRSPQIPKAAPVFNHAGSLLLSGNGQIESVSIEQETEAPVTEQELELAETEDGAPESLSP